MDRKSSILQVDFPAGTRVRVTSVPDRDDSGLSVGTTGTVRYAQDGGIVADWDTGKEETLLLSDHHDPYFWTVDIISHPQDITQQRHDLTSLGHTLLRTRQ